MSDTHGIALALCVLALGVILFDELTAAMASFVSALNKHLIYIGMLIKGAGK